MLIIGLTGGIACGKSAVSFILKKLGAQVLDIDEITHELLEPILMFMFNISANTLFRRTVHSTKKLLAKLFSIIPMKGNG